MIKQGKFVANVVVKISDKSKLSFDATGDRVYENRDKLGAYVQQQLINGYLLLGGINDGAVAKDPAVSGNAVIVFVCGGPKVSLSIDFNSLHEVAEQIDVLFRRYKEPEQLKPSVTAPVQVKYSDPEPPKENLKSIVKEIVKKRGK